jgi:hypothetical protein
VTLKVFPVFDSVRPVGPDSDTPVLTHFGAVQSDVEEMLDQD